jgi:hypothetical protein
MTAIDAKNRVTLGFGVGIGVDQPQRIKCKPFVR